jgi:hypothetical protein
MPAGHLHIGDDDVDGLSTLDDVHRSVAGARLDDGIALAVDMPAMPMRMISSSSTRRIVGMFAIAIKKLGCLINVPDRIRHRSHPTSVIGEKFRRQTKIISDPLA